MGKNFINLSNSTQGEYEKNLGILTADGYGKFLHELKEKSINRNLSGMVNFEALEFLQEFLLSFDEVRFDERYGSLLHIGDWEKLREASRMFIEPEQFKLWVYRDTICEVSSMIDEDLRYGRNDEFLRNLRDFLCALSIVEE